MSSTYKDAGSQAKPASFQGGLPDFYQPSKPRQGEEDSGQEPLPIPTEGKPAKGGDRALATEAQAHYGDLRVAQLYDAHQKGTLPACMRTALEEHIHFSREQKCYLCRKLPIKGGLPKPCMTCLRVACNRKVCSKTIAIEVEQCKVCQGYARGRLHVQPEPARTRETFLREMLTDMVTRGGPGHKEQPEWAVLEGFVNCMKSDDVEAFKALVTSAQKKLRPNVAKGKDPPIWESWYRTPLRLGMSLLHLAIAHSALEIFRGLLRLEQLDVNASTIGPSIRGKVAATPPLHLAVLAAARHGCDPSHASWTVLQELLKDPRLDRSAIKDFEGRTADEMAEHLHANPVTDVLEGRPPQALVKLPGPPVLAVFQNPLVLGHKTSAAGTEPQNEDGIRIEAIIEALQPLAQRHQVLFRDGSLATREDLLEVHSEAHVTNVEASLAEAASMGDDVVHSLDYLGDTLGSKGSMDAVLASGGMVGDAIVTVFTDEHISRAFCLTRPPGHHASRDGMPHTCPHVHPRGKGKGKRKDPPSEVSSADHKKPRLEGATDGAKDKEGEEGEAGGSTLDHKQPSITRKERELSMGFCLSDNARVGARRAFKERSVADAVKKVVGEANVLDLCWLDTDCHRGNGGTDTMSQAKALGTPWEMVTSDGLTIKVNEYKFDVFICGEFVKMEGKEPIVYDFYAGGTPSAREEDDDEDAEEEEEGDVDFPVDLAEHRTPSSRRDALRKRFKKILKKLQARRPHVLVWCFGADNHAFDDGASPAGVGGLHSKDQADLARWIRKALPWLRIVVVQEGGYAVQGRSAGSLPRSVYAVVNALSCPEDELLNDAEDERDVLIEGEEVDLLSVPESDDETSSDGTAEEDQDR